VAKRRSKLWGSALPGWAILATALALTAVVTALSTFNIRREERYMSQILVEKGTALIRTFEAATRTGIVGMRDSFANLQTLLEETASQRDILFLAVTDRQGKILAHNRSELVGTQLFAPTTFESSSVDAKQGWLPLQSPSGKEAFAVYQAFTSIPSRIGVHSRRQSTWMDFCGPNHLAWMDRCLGDQASGQIPPLIFVGLDPEPFREALKQDIRMTVLLAAVLVVLGLGGLFSVVLARKYRTYHDKLLDINAIASEVVASLPLGLVVTDLHGVVVFLNQTAEGILGVVAQINIGKSIQEYWPPEMKEVSVRLRQGERILEEEFSLTLREGKLMPVSVSASHIMTVEKVTIGFVYIIKDMKEVRQLQDALRRREKLAAIGNLAAGVAHEVRNPLSSIKGFAAYFAVKYPDGSDEKIAATTMMTEVDRLNKVISDLLDFSRTSDLQIKETDITILINHSLSLIRHDAEIKGINISVSIPDDLPHVRLDPDRFTQALLNLYLNAMQAMNQSGELSVRAEQDHYGHIRILISDTGPGINAEHIHDIFKPYFTTKPKGTGLGLAIVQKIVEAHNGTITVSSEQGRGTEISINLPLDYRD